MSISVQSIIVAINDRLKADESTTTPSTTMLDAITAGLRWISEQANWSCLYNYDTSQSVIAGGFTLDFPADYKDLDYITLNDGIYEGPPLKELDGGFQQWLKNREDETSSNYDEPICMVQRGKKWYLDPKADQTYTADIWYWKYHPVITGLSSTILFGDRFTEPVKLACIAAYLDSKQRHSEATYFYTQAAILLGPLEDTEADFAVERHFVKYHDI